MLGIGILSNTDPIFTQVPHLLMLLKVAAREHGETTVACRQVRDILLASIYQSVSLALYGVDWSFMDARATAIAAMPPEHHHL